MGHKWVPIECNPDVFNTLAYSIGVPKTVEFTDVWSLDKEMLAFVPRPVYAIILVFPITKNYEQKRITMDAQKPADYYNAISGTNNEQILWFKQTIGNACGTMALIHAVANALPEQAPSTSVIGRLLETTKLLNVYERAKYLEQDRELEHFHAVEAQGGETEAPPAQDQIETHYVCFCRSCKDGHLYELDGRRTGPIDHGEIPDDVLCDKSIETIQNFFKADPLASFSLMAMVAAT